MHIKLIGCGSGHVGKGTIESSTITLFEALSEHLKASAFVAYDSLDMYDFTFPRLSHRIKHRIAQCGSMWKTGECALVLPVSWANWVIVGSRDARDIILAAAMFLKNVNVLIADDCDVTGWERAQEVYRNTQYMIWQDCVFRKDPGTLAGHKHATQMTPVKQLSLHRQQ